MEKNGHSVATLLRLKSKTLSKNEELLHTITENAPDLIIQLDQRGIILYMNRAYPGYILNESIGKNFREWTLPEYHELMNHSLNLVFDKSTTQTYLSRGIDKEEQMHWYRTRISPVREGKRVRSAVLITRDITDSILGEQIQRESEKKLAEIYASMSEGLAIHELIFDPSGKAVDYVITEVNPAYEKITGIKYEDAVDKRASTLYMTNDAPFLNIFAQVESTGLSTSFETYFAPINRHFYISVFSPGKGQFVTVFRDITIQKQAEYALIKSEEKFSLIYEKSPYAISLCSPTDGRIEEVNKAFAKILGYSKEEITGKKTDELTIHIDAKKRKIIIEHFNRYGFVHDLEDIFYTKSGKPRILRYNIDSVELGNQKHILVTAENITASKKTELALREREFFFRETQKAAFIGSFKTIPNTGLWESSEVLDQIFGIDKSYVKNYEGWLSIIHPDDRIRINDYLRNEVFPKGVLADKEFRIIRKNDGQMRWVHALGRIESNAKNKVSSMLGTIQDITERKRKEAALLKLNQILATLSKSSQAMAQAMDEEEYLNQICNIIIEDNDFTSVWIGYAEEDNEKTIRPVASAGFKDNYLEAIRLSWDDNGFGGGPTGVAIRTGNMSICSNMLTDPTFEPWREQALKQGYASCISFPLKSGDIIFGAITIYSKEPDSFFTDEIKLLNKLAYDLVLGITTIRLKAENKLAEKELIKSHSLLEELVKERTTELMFANETLKLTEEKYRTVADFATNWEFWLSPDDQMIYCSPSCEQVTGYTVDEFEDHSNLIMDIIHPDDLQIYQEHKAMELHSNICAHDIRFRILRKDGMIRWISHHCQPVFDETGKSRGIRGSNKDITGPKKMEELLKTNNRKFSLLSANISDGIFIYKKDCFDYVNSAMTHIFGYSEHEFTEMNLNQLVTNDNIGELEFINQPKTPISKIRNVELECIRKDKSTVFVEFLFNYVAKEKVIYGVVHDITDKKQIQRNILKAIIQTEEIERASFSKELHDGVGPLLSAIKLYLQWSERAKSEKSRQEIILKAEEILEETLVAVKEISNKLSPHLLINHGLVSAIQSFIGKLEETSVIHFSFEHHVIGRLTSEIEAALYRAIIECINNTIKYAGAKNITIILNERDNQIWVQYRDDGIGFDLPETLAAKKGLGLFNLQNRIHNIGGKITLYSEPGKGVDYQIIIDI